MAITDIGLTRYQLFPQILLESFHCQFEEFPTDKLRIIATDIDGPQNGSYEKDSTNLTLSSDDYKGNTGSWFKGSVEKEIKFNLKRKDKE